MCDKAVEEDSCALELVPDWFVTHEQVKIWHDEKYYDDYEIIVWYDGYKKTQGSKSKNKRRALTQCLAPIKILELVHDRRKKKRDRKIVFDHLIY